MMNVGPASKGPGVGVRDQTVPLMLVRAPNSSATHVCRRGQTAHSHVLTLTVCKGIDHTVRGMHLLIQNI